MSLLLFALLSCVEVEAQLSVAFVVFHESSTFSFCCFEDAIDAHEPAAGAEESWCLSHDDEAFEDVFIFRARLGGADAIYTYIL